MKIDTLGHLVDTQPAYNALVELKDRRGNDAATKAFLNAKLKATIRDLHSTATYLDEQLRALSGDDAPQPTTPLDPAIREDIIRCAGEEVLRVFTDEGRCLLCHYDDHDNDGGERHEDECPLRPLDEVSDG